MSRTPLRVGQPVRPPGADAPEILARIGLSDSLDALVASGAIRLPNPAGVSRLKVAPLQLPRVRLVTALSLPLPLGEGGGEGW